MLLKLKENVTLRRKQLQNGNESLYLDIYVEGKRSYEFLKLYLTPGKGQIEKEKNKEALALAQTIKAQRQIEIQSGVYGFGNKSKEKIAFLSYFLLQTEKRRHNQSKKTYSIWLCVYQHLVRYTQPGLKMKQVNAAFVEGFKTYLCEQSLSANTQFVYFSKLSTCLNEAFKEGILVRPIHVCAPKKRLCKKSILLWKRYNSYRIPRLVTLTSSACFYLAA